MNCVICGAANAPGVTHCGACGVALDAGATNGGAAVAFNPALPSGTKLQNGAYTVGQVLGQGGFGITYKGGDMALRRFVAIKEFFPPGCVRQSSLHTIVPTGGSAQDFTSSKVRFLDEARTLARFNHPGIVRVYSIFEENNTAYMVMEFLEGQTLAERLKQSVLNEREAVDLARRIGGALEVVHSANLIHRDLKPDNIFLAKGERAVLIDFGTARQYALNRTVRQTALLTPGYAPLEQYGSTARFGAYSDVYALAATLYHAVTGQAPPPATDRVTGVELRRADAVNPHVSAPLGHILEWAMQLKAEHRPQSVAEFLNALPSATGQGVTGRSAAPRVSTSLPNHTSLPNSTPHNAPPSFPGSTPPSSSPTSPSSLPVPQSQPSTTARTQAVWPSAAPSTPVPTPLPDTSPPGTPLPGASPGGALWIRRMQDDQILTNADPYRSMEALAKGMRLEKVSNVTLDPRTLQVRGSRGVGLTSWGQQIHGQVIVGAQGTAITVRAQESGPAITDFGRGKALVAAILRATEIALRTDPHITQPSTPPIQEPSAYPAYYPPQQGYPQPQGYPQQQFRSMVQGGKGSSVVALGILGLICCGFLAPVAWVMGNNALQEYGDQDPGDRGAVIAGRGMGIAGTCLLILGTIFWLLVAASES